jgi:uncharacterized MnhB-related membrane protein
VTGPPSGKSRKTHGAAGNFDVDLPLSGPPGIECRSGGATNDYTIVLIFAAEVTVNGNGMVNASDVALTKSQIGQPVNQTNFRADVSAGGSINATDVSIVKANLGSGLP